MYNISRFESNTVLNGGIRIGLDQPRDYNRLTYYQVIKEQLVGVVVWKFSASDFRNIIVADGARVLTTKTSGSLPQNEWLDAIQRVKRIIIAQNSKRDYLKIQYRTVHKGT